MNNPPKRKRATKALQRNRVEAVILAKIRGATNDEILPGLISGGVSRRQAYRYLEIADEEIARAGREGPSNWELGLKLKRAEFFILHVMEEAIKEGGDFRAAWEAHKNDIATNTAIEKLRKKQGGSHDRSETRTDSQTDRFAEILRLFVREEPTG